jgi:hypothetical protein
MLGSSWVAAQLVASQEGLSSMSEWLLICIHRTFWHPQILQDSIWKLQDLAVSPLETINPVPGSTVFVHRNACLISWTLFQNVTQVCVHCMHILHSWLQMFWHDTLCLILNKLLYPPPKMYWCKCNPFLHLYLFYYGVMLTNLRKEILKFE